MLLTLFWTFLKIGLMSFGGGYAMIPIISREVRVHNWLTDQEFTDAVALAGMGPGPIATNSATIIGYKTSGMAGAIVSTVGMVLPSLVLIIVIAAFFYKISGQKWVKSSFYGLRPIVTGLIVYAAVHFGIGDGTNFTITWQVGASICMTIAVIIAIMKYRVHPLAVILISGLAGIALFH